jgi:hypothetical protein
MVDSNTLRVTRARQKKLNDGWRYIPRGMLSPEAAEVMDALLAMGYGESYTAVITHAILEAGEKNLKKSFKTP